VVDGIVVDGVVVDGVVKPAQNDSASNQRGASNQNHNNHKEDTCAVVDVGLDYRSSPLTNTLNPISFLF
jgi:hypothetical protein